MPAFSSKPLSEKSQEQALQAAINDADKTLGTSGYLTSKVGAKMQVTFVQSSPAIDDYRFFDIINTQNGNVTLGSPVVTGLMNALTTLTVGQYAIATDIPQNSTIISIDSNTQVTLSANATNTNNEPIKFANLLYQIRLQYDDSLRTNLLDVERLA